MTENKKDLSEVYNMIWTAGFNSGVKVCDELHQGKIDVAKMQERANELLKEDADGIMELLKLKSQMGM